MTCELLSDALLAALSSHLNIVAYSLTDWTLGSLEVELRLPVVCAV